MSPCQALGLLTIALAFAIHEATALGCYAGCNLQIKTYEDSPVPRALDDQKRPVQLGCHQIPRFISNDTSLLVGVQYTPQGVWNNRSFSALHVLERGTERIVPLQGRPWLVSVVNARTLGYFATGWDTEDDVREVATFRLQDVYTGRSEKVPLPSGSHDAHYNRATNTIFYLKVGFRTLQHPCAIPWEPSSVQRDKMYLLETVVEVDLDGRTLWSMPVEQAVCHRPLVQYDTTYGGCTANTHNESNARELFHMNYVVYLHHRDELIITSKFQSTAYVISKSRRTLLWSIGAHGTIHMPWLAIHCFMPLGGDRYAVYHNNIAEGHATAVLVVQVKRDKKQATVLHRLENPKRTCPGGKVFARVSGSGIGIGAGKEHLLGASFRGNDLYLQRFDAVGRHTKVADCTFSVPNKYGGWFYGMTFVYRSFGLTLTLEPSNGPGQTPPIPRLFFHAAHWDSEPIDAVLVVWLCSAGAEQGEPPFAPGLQTRAAVQLPPFLQTGSRQLPSTLYPGRGSAVCVWLQAADGFVAKKRLFFEPQELAASLHWPALLRRKAEP